MGLAEYVAVSTVVHVLSILAHNQSICPSDLDAGTLLIIYMRRGV